MSEEKTVFDELFKLNVNEHVEKKNTGKVSLSYLSWSWAWAEVKKRYPNASYEIKMFDGKPYSYDELTGYMCFTSVTIEGVTHEMWLPVMDSHNDAMLSKPYEVKTKYGTYTVEKCTMFDVNKTIMRCLTKNLAMFGLGLYIYSGEDLPEDCDDKKSNNSTLSPEAERERKSTLEKDPKFIAVRDEVKNYMSEPFIEAAQKEKINKAIEECNIKYLESICTWCKEQMKKGA